MKEYLNKNFEVLFSFAFLAFAFLLAGVVEGFGKSAALALVTFVCLGVTWVLVHGALKYKLIK